MTHQVPAVMNADATEARVQQWLDGHKSSLTNIFSSNAKEGLDYYLTTAVREIRKNDRLLQADKQSLMECVELSVRLALPIGKQLGHLWVVPYGKIATPIIGYKGYLQLSRRMRSVEWVDAQLVYDGETFHWDAVNASVVHEARMDLRDDPQNIVAGWAMAKLRDVDRKVVLTLTRAQIDRRQQKSSDAWRNHYEAMARKTLIRAVFNGGLIDISESIEMQHAIQADYESEERMQKAEYVEVRAASSPAAPKAPPVPVAVEEYGQEAPDNVLDERRQEATEEQDDGWGPNPEAPEADEAERQSGLYGPDIDPDGDSTKPHPAF